MYEELYPIVSLLRNSNFDTTLPLDTMPDLFEFLRKKNDDDIKAAQLVKPLSDWMVLKAEKDEINIQKASEAEKEILSNILSKGITWGVAGGVSSMLFLRIAPRFASKWFSRRATGARDPLQQQQPVVKKNLGYYVGGALDVTMGVLWGAVIWYGSTPTKYIYEQNATIPLLPGRSHIADALCTDSIRYFQESPRELWTRYGKNDEVDGWKKFIDNCRKRQKYEEQLRQELGYSEDQPVDIPATGVPKAMFLDN